MLPSLLAPILEPAFTFSGVATTWAELLGFATGLVCVGMVARQNIWNWPVGIANVILLGVVFLEVGLYADAALQLVYVVLSLYGWWQWLYGGSGRSRLAVSRTTPAEWVALAMAGVAATGAMTWVLDVWTDSTVPFFDGLTTALSLVATYGQTRKRLESWWIWIAADLIYVPLYLYKGLTLTAVLYVVFLGLCVWGWIGWRRAVTRGPVA
jgi:nicotinamide mononucleotide transporter